MKLAVTLLCGTVLSTQIALAQPRGDVQVFVSADFVAANGAEIQAGVRRGTGPIAVGQTTIGLFSLRECAAFTVTRPPEAFEPNARATWRVEVTPLKVVNHAVTFRLRWSRASGGGSHPNGEDVEVTLRPGESRPLDTVSIGPGEKEPVDGRPCAAKSASLRVSVEFPAFDRRLFGVNVWLVERLPNGKEDSQLQAVRGLPNRPVPFYFDGVPDGTQRLDFFGKLVADLKSNGIGLEVETIRAGAHAGQQGYQSSQWYRSTLQVKPDEIVEIALPSADGKANGGRRAFSLRIQAKQIR